MIQYKKKLLNLMLFGYGGAMIVLVGMLTGLMFLNSNVLYQNGFLVKAWDICISVIDVFAFAMSVVVLIYGIYLLGARALSTVYAAFLCITVFHYISILSIGWLIFPGTLPETIGELAAFFFEEVIAFVVLDCLRLFIIGLIAVKKLAKCEEERKASNRRASILGEAQLSERSIAFPLTSFVSFKNPLLLTAFIASAIYWLTFYIQYVYYDLMTLIKLDFFEGASLQLVTLAANAVFACICYCIITFTLMKLDEKLPKQN